MGLKIKIKNSIVCLGDSVVGNSIKKEILGFDLANSTPVDCMDFIRTLQERYGGSKVTGIQ